MSETAENKPRGTEPTPSSTESLPRDRLIEVKSPEHSPQKNAADAKKPEVKWAKPTSAQKSRKATGTSTDEKEQKRKAEARLKSWQKLYKDSESKTWAVAKYAAESVRNYNLTQKQLGEAVNTTGQRVGQYIAAAEVVAKVESATAIDYSSRVSVDVAKAVADTYKALSTEDRKIFPLEDIMSHASDGLSARRVRAKITELARERRIKEIRSTARASNDTEWRSRCHEGDCRNYFATLEDHSVQIIHADVPYADYRGASKNDHTENKSDRRNADDGYVSGHDKTSVVLTASAMNNYKDALDLTEDIIRTAGKKLKSEGVLLLWQAGTRPLRSSVQSVIEACGLEVAFELVLDKRYRPDSTEAGQPGKFDEPYSIASEKLVVIKRVDERFIRCDHNLPRSDIIGAAHLNEAVRVYKKEFEKPFYSWADGMEVTGWTPSRCAFSAYKADRKRVAETHGMQKHEEISLFLLMKHCRPRDLVVDACGCSASFCIAAEQYECDWHYCEMPVVLNDKGVQKPESGNFDFGVERLAQYFEWASEQSGAEACEHAR